MQVIFLLTKAGVSQRDIGKVIALGPELLGCSISKKLDPNVKYFLSLGIKLQILGEMIADFPMLLRYNMDVLRPKYRYLRRMMVRPLQDLIEFPRYFTSQSTLFAFILVLVCSYVVSVWRLLKLNNKNVPWTEWVGGNLDMLVDSSCTDNESS